jgi:hypothetical protein
VDVEGDPMDGDTGIHTGEAVPPWEEPGCFRMDCEPYRGELLKGMASLSVAIVFLSICPLACFSVVLAFPLSLLVWLLARRDLARMRRGLMDPYGEGPTDGARRLSFAAFVTAVIVAAYWTFIFMVLSLR